MPNTYPVTCPLLRDDCIAEACMMWRYGESTSHDHLGKDVTVEGFYYCGMGGFPKNDTGRIPDD